jgi:protein ImuB
VGNVRVLYVHFPRFPVQATVRLQPWLSHKPLVLIEEVKGQRRVRWASSSAMKEGVVPGQTLTAAQAFISEVQHFYFNEKDNNKALQSIGEALLQWGPAFQLNGPCGLWLDASAAQLYGGEEKLAESVRAQLDGLGYASCVVLSGQLFLSQLLAQRGVLTSLVVKVGQEYEAMQSLPLSSLGAQFSALQAGLSQVGLQTLGQVGALPVSSMAARFGVDGVKLARLVQGRDDLPFVATALAESFEEHLEFGFPAESLEPVLFAMKSLLDALCARLNGRRLAVLRLKVVLQLEPRLSEIVVLRLARPSTQVRLLLEIFRVRMESVQLPHPVAALSVTVVEHCPAPMRQVTLDEHPQQETALEVVLARLSTALGDEALQQLQTVSRFRPEQASDNTAFTLPERPAPLLENAAPHCPASTSAHGTERPTRFLTSPEPIEVIGQWRFVVLASQRYEVLALHGPETVSGVWWGQKPTPTRDYYRIWLNGLGAAWVAQEHDTWRTLLVGWFD